MSDVDDAREAYRAAMTEEPRAVPMFDECAARWRNDAHFANAVEMMTHAALVHGFTPYELKQIAFMAAMNVEMRATKKWRFRP